MNVAMNPGAELNKIHLITNTLTFPMGKISLENNYKNQQMVEKIAGTGLSYQHLEDIFEKLGEKALIGVLSHPPASNATANKSPRVTKTKRILASIVEHFQRKKARIQQTENP